MQVVPGQTSADESRKTEKRVTFESPLAEETLPPIVPMTSYRRKKRVSPDKDKQCGRTCRSDKSSQLMSALTESAIEGGSALREVPGTMVMRNGGAPWQGRLRERRRPSMPGVPVQY
jgi:hypothetical protein